MAFGDHGYPEQKELNAVAGRRPPQDEFWHPGTRTANLASDLQRCIMWLINDDQGDIVPYERLYIS
jgi:hypothetical protein